MDDTRIRELTEEVLGQLGSAPREEGAGLEARVARLEGAVRALQGSLSTAAPVAVTAVLAARQAVSHPALRLLDVPHGTDRCVLEPDKPCEKSGACRALGY